MKAVIRLLRRIPEKCKRRGSAAHGSPIAPGRRNPPAALQATRDTPRCLNFLCVVVMFGAGVCLGAGHAEMAAQLKAVEQILSEGLPTIASAKLDLIDGSDWPVSDQRKLAVLRARAKLLVGKAPAALEALSPFATSGSAEVDFWLGEVYAALGEYALARDSYRSCANDPVQALGLGPDAKIGLARMLAALGDGAGGIAVLQDETSQEALLEKAAISLDLGDIAFAQEILEQIPEESPARDYLLARAATSLGDREAALSILRQSTPPLHSQLALQQTLLAAQLELDLGRSDKAEELLETLIDQHPRQQALPEAFALLDEVYARGSSPTFTELQRWADQENHPSRRALALYYLARSEARNARYDRAAETYKLFLNLAPEHPLANPARIGLSEVFLAQGKLQPALDALLNAQGADIDFARGLAKAAAGDYSGAAIAFDAARAASASPQAAYNSALARILSGEPIPQDPLLGETDREALALAQAFSLAARRDPSTATVLAQILSDKNASPAAALAMAEWEFLHGDFSSAKSSLQRISNQDPAVSERASALAVFLEDSGSEEGEPRALTAGEQFLENYPDSPLAPSVALKLGEILFRRGDYLSARARFDQVANLPEAGPLAEKALFLAAQSAARSMDEAGIEEAVEIYDDLARREGALALRARLAQAMLLNARGRQEEAIPVLDTLLAANPDEALRFAAIIEKGDTLFSMGEENPSAYREAIAIWRLAAEPETPPRWRNQALVKIAAASERLGEIPAALSSTYDVLDSPQTDEPEFFWYFKAGFDAARLLESEDRYEEAAAIYEKLAAKGGPRSEEAGQRLNRLKLENFLWED